MKRLFLVPLALLASFVLSTPPASAGFIVINSWAAPDGTLLDGGVEDPQFIVTTSNQLDLPANTPSKVVLEQYPIGTWLLNGPNSKWIAPTANQNAPGGQASSGSFYIFRTTFNLTGYDLATVRGVGRFTADNFSAAILNNTPLGVNANDFTKWNELVITNGFVQGENILEFTVSGTGSSAAVDSTGLRVEMTITGCSSSIPPGIVTHPRSKNAFIGKPATLSVIPGCEDGTSYAWRKNGEVISGATGANLTFQSFKPSDAGLYDVVVSNASGAITSKVAQLKLKFLPNSGVDDFGVPIPAGQSDGHFKLTSSADSAHPGPDAKIVNQAYPIGTWMVNNAESKWIAPQANQDNNLGQLGGNVEGDYTYTYSFDTTGVTKEQLRFTGRMLSDNEASLSLNGNLVATSASFTTWTEFNLDSYLLDGVNTLTVRVHNGPGAGPTGLRLEFQDTVLPVGFFDPPVLEVLSQIPDGTTFLKLKGTPSQTYQIQSRLRLDDPLESWSYLNQFTLEASELEFEDTDFSLPVQKFYRALIAPAP